MSICNVVIDPRVLCFGWQLRLEYEAWGSQDYFALLGELKTNLDENEQQLSDIDYLYEKYKSHIPLK